MPKGQTILGWKYAEYLDGFRYLVIDRYRRYNYAPIAMVFGSRKQAKLRGKLMAASIKMLEACVIGLNEIGSINSHAKRSAGKDLWNVPADCQCSKCKAMRQILAAINEAGGKNLLANPKVRGLPEYRLKHDGVEIEDGVEEEDNE